VLEFCETLNLTGDDTLRQIKILNRWKNHFLNGKGGSDYLIFTNKLRGIESGIIPLFSLRRCSSSLGFNSSSAEHEHLRTKKA